MSLKLLRDQTILQLIDADTTLLTPNRRLAATLHTLFQQKQLDDNLKAWETPDILPITNWFQRLFNDYTHYYAATAPLLLTPFQESNVWERIITESPQTSLLLHVSKMIEKVQAAWMLGKQWQINFEDELFNLIDDCAAFKNWANQFNDECKTKNWLSQAALPEFIIENILPKKNISTKQFILLGFNELPPLWQQLFSSLATQNIKIEQLQITYHEEENHSIQATTFIDEEEEIITMARWAKSIAQTTPSAKIACVVPSLETKRDTIWRIFSNVFTKLQTDELDKEISFNISAGKSLLQYPIIHAAMNLLDIQEGQLTAKNFSSILLSAFLGESEYEYIARAQFDAHLKNKNISTINLRILLEKDHYLGFQKKCPKLAKRLESFFELLVKQQKINQFSDWVKIFCELLALLGWPGERSLISEEYQVVENYFKAIAQLSSLDYLKPAVDIKHALQALRRLLSQTVFQPKTPEANVQILGMLEAAAIPFDHLWLMGMNDMTWPPLAKPNPFIPRQIQRKLQMPHATALRELSYCQHLLEQFKHCAKNLIVSYASIYDELHVQMSPLIRHIPLIQFPLTLANYLPHWQLIHQAKQLIYLSDENVLPLTPNQMVKGGINILKQQALCPFKAFAEIRLHAVQLEPIVSGMRAKDRGSLIHSILENIWQQLGDQHNLLALSEDACNKLIDDSISFVLNQFSINQLDREQYFKLEKKRLHRIVKSWLDIEKKRSPFSVSMQEKSVDLTLDKMTLSIRIDRIDELPNGKKLIIDYKTGKNNHISNWFGERLEDPQLPLYCLLDAANTVGISFAQLAPGAIGFKGISQASLDIDGIQPIEHIKSCANINWQEQIAIWKSGLEKTAYDFVMGVAKVDPKHHPDTCEWCALMPFCRINEEINHDKQYE